MTDSILDPETGLALPPVSAEESVRSVLEAINRQSPRPNRFLEHFRSDPEVISTGRAIPKPGRATLDLSFLPDPIERGATKFRDDVHWIADRMQLYALAAQQLYMIEEQQKEAAARNNPQQRGLAGTVGESAKQYYFGLGSYPIEYMGSGGGWMQLGATGLRQTTGDSDLANIIDSGGRLISTFTDIVAETLFPKPRGDILSAPQISRGVGKGAAQMAHQISTGSLARLAGFGKVGALAGFTGTAAAPVVADRFIEARQYWESRGDASDTAQRKAVYEASVAGLITGVTNIPIGSHLLGLIGGKRAIQLAAQRAAMRLFAATGKGIAGESFQEVSEQVLTDAMASLIRDDPSLLDDIISFDPQYMKTLLHSAIVGGIVGGKAGALTHTGSEYAKTMGTADQQVIDEFASVMESSIGIFTEEEVEDAARRIEEVDRTAAERVRSAWRRHHEAEQEAEIRATEPAADSPYGPPRRDQKAPEEGTVFAVVDRDGLVEAASSGLPPRTALFVSEAASADGDGDIAIRINLDRANARGLVEFDGQGISNISAIAPDGIEVLGRNGEWAPLTGPPLSPTQETAEAAPEPEAPLQLQAQQGGQGVLPFSGPATVAAPESPAPTITPERVRVGDEVEVTTLDGPFAGRVAAVDAEGFVTVAAVTDTGDTRRIVHNRNIRSINGQNVRLRPPTVEDRFLFNPRKQGPMVGPLFDPESNEVKGLPKEFTVDPRQIQNTIWRPGKRLLGSRQCRRPRRHAPCHHAQGPGPVRGASVSRKPLGGQGWRHDGAWWRAARNRERDMERPARPGNPRRPASRDPCRSRRNLPPGGHRGVPRCAWPVDGGP